MERENKNNRSIFALAGESSISSAPIKMQQSRNAKQITAIKPIPNITMNPKVFDPKLLIKQLGLGRLRKMQALVRGFIVRRTVYPRELKDYLIAQSLLDLIIANVVYREGSGIVVESITLGRYDQDMGEDRLIEQYLYNRVIRRVIEKQFEPVARQAIYETAMFASRPNITYGLNMRHPLELILFQKLNETIAGFAKQIAEETLVEEAVYRRELQVVNQLIGNMGLIRQLCEEVVSECLLEGVGEFVVENMIDRITKEGVLVVAESCYGEAIAREEDGFVEELVEQAQEWFLQEAVLRVLLEGDDR